jgi:uncharacterized protein (TIGR02147 family)
MDLIQDIEPTPSMTTAQGPSPVINSVTSSPAASSPAPAAIASLLPQGPQVSEYLDYRQYLQDFYLYKRSQTQNQLRPYTYSVFAAAADIKSPNYLKMIIEGKRNLSEDMIAKFARALSLNKARANEFKLLVLFNQATDPSERNMLLKELSEVRVETKIKSGEIDQKSWDKLPSWVAWVVYAMIDQDGVSFKTEELKTMLRGKARADEIEQAIQSLINSGEVTKDEQGKLKKARQITDHAEDIPVALIRKLQAQLMLLGLESIYEDNPTEREFGTLTMALTKSEFEEIRFKLRQMRKQLHKDNSIARMSAPGERVYQLNLQLFPVTNAKK